MIGIDKTVIKGFRMELMDKDKLLKNSNVVLQEKEMGVLTKGIDGSDIEIDYLKVTDGHVFNHLIMGVKYNKGIRTIYSMIELSIAEDSDSNLKPLNVSEYRNKIKRLFKYLEDMYGLYFNVDELYLDDMEINITVQMDRQFVEYEYLLNNMVYLVPRKYNISPYIDKDRTVKQYTFFNNAVEGKIYDKSRQLNEKFEIKRLDKQYMRIEYTLHGSKKIESSLGTRLVAEITDKAIEEYLFKQINQDLIKPIQKHIAESDKKLLNMALDLKEKDSRRWARMFLTTAIAQKQDFRNGALPLVIDIEQIKEIIGMVSPPKNLKRTLERLKGEMDIYTYLLNNFTKLDEIIGKFTN